MDVFCSDGKSKAHDHFQTISINFIHSTFEFDQIKVVGVCVRCENDSTLFWLNERQWAREILFMAISTGDTSNKEFLCILICGNNNNDHRHRGNERS